MKTLSKVKKSISSEDFLINIQHILNCDMNSDEKAQWVLDHCCLYEHGEIRHKIVK